MNLDDALPLAVYVLEDVLSPVMYFNWIDRSIDTRSTACYILMNITQRD